MATDAEILAAVKDAIYDLVLTKKAVARLTLAGRTVQNYTLTELQSLEEYYTSKVARSSRTRILLADVSRRDS